MDDETHTYYEVELKARRNSYKCCSCNNRVWFTPNICDNCKLEEFLRSRTETTCPYCGVTWNYRAHHRSCVFRDFQHKSMSVNWEFSLCSTREVLGDLWVIEHNEKGFLAYE